MSSVQYEIACPMPPPRVITDRPPGADIDCDITPCERRLLRRLRQIRRGKFAQFVLLEVPTMTLRLVSIDDERLDNTT